MNKLKIKANVIDLGVAENNDDIIIYGHKDSVYVTIVCKLDIIKKFYYSKGTLIYVGGEQVTPKDVESMKKLLKEVKE